MSKEDHPHDNQNKTYYRDQINKVAIAVKELIQGMKNPQPQDDEITVERYSNGPMLRRRILKLTFIFIALAIGYFVYDRVIVFKKSFSNGGTAQTSSIAVLPFTNLSNDPEQEYFCDGITDQIITSLARLKNFKVIAFTTVMRYKKNPKSIADIGKELNVTHVLEGSVRKSSNQIRVSAKLVSVNDESNLWTEDFNNKLVADILPIQDAVSARIASSLNNELLPGEKEKLISEKPSNPEAYEHYLKGLYIHFTYFDPHRLEEDFQKAEREFKHAIHLDAAYASAYAALADLHDTHGSPNDSVTKYADMAYRLNPSLPYALVAKYQSHNERIFDQTDSLLRVQQLDSAFRYIRKAYEAAPNNVLVCNELGSFIGNTVGLYPEGIAILKHSVKIDPAGVHQLAEASRLFYYSGDNVNALKYANEALAINPNNIFGLGILFRINCEEGNSQKASEILEKLTTINPQMFMTPFLPSYLMASKGNKEKALALNKVVPRDFRPDLFFLLQMKKEAINEIANGVRENWRFNYIFFQRKIFNFLRGDPRFGKILLQTKAQHEARLKKYGNIDLPKD